MPISPNLEDRNQDIPDVFLPEHLRLHPGAGLGNWHAYKHAVETVCRLKGVTEHLTVIYVNPPKDKDWLWREEFCKAIITLNVVNFPAYGISAHEGVGAREVWWRLCEIHRPKRTCWGLTGWVRLPTTVEWVLLWLLLVMAVLLGLRVPSPSSLWEREMQTHAPTLRIPPMEYYRDLLRDYHSNSY